MQCTINVRSHTYVGATNISENTQFAKYNSTPKFVDLQYNCIVSTKKNAGHYIPCFHLIKDPRNVQLSCYLFFFKLHQLKHRWNIWWITHIAFKKYAYVLKNLHTWSALHSILLRGAAVNLAILVMPFLTCQYSHLVQPLLTMYTQQSLKWVQWSQLLYSIRSCEQHMLSWDVQLHCVRNKKAFICQKKKCCRALYTVFISSKIQ